MQRLQARQITTFALTALTTAWMVACSPARWHETRPNSNVVIAAPNTGDPLSEQQTVPKVVQPTQPGQTATVRPTNLCGHRIKNSNCDTQLEKGDEVEVVDPTPQTDGTIAVKPKKTHLPPREPNHPIEPVYVPPQYLSTEPVAPPKEEVAQDRFFVVQNIATEILRVYENCAWKGGDLATCHHRLVLQTPMVVGEDRSGKRTRLGSFRVSQWQKFYQDKEDDYPSYYTPTSPALPAAGASLEAWIAKSLLPQGRGSVRGAFGWYTAYLTPDADEQWLHGSWGWGADGTTFIDQLHDAPWANNPLVASHGCTRVENRAIALLREYLVPGTKVIRIYAKEAYAQAPQNKATPRTGKWAWELTRSNSPEAPRAGRVAVEATHPAADEILESGTYEFSAEPVAKALSNAKNPHESGNVYGLPRESFKGVLLVDEGRTSEYAHPRGLKVGGLPSHDLPSVARIQ